MNNNKQQGKKEGVEASDIQKDLDVSEENLIQIKESEYHKILKDVEDYKDKYVRILAEFDNARKRMEREKLEFLKYANEDLIVEFLEILDDLERTVAVANEKHQDYDAFLKGVEIVMKHIDDVFKKNGVKPIEAKGKAFDPHCQEILMQEETDVAAEGIVLEEFQKGYMLGEKVVRTAKVKVAQKKTS